MISSDNNKDRQRIQTKDATSKLIGAFGKWQCEISILMALLKISTAWYQLNIIFLAPPQDFWCEQAQRTIAHYNYSHRDNSNIGRCQVVPPNDTAPGKINITLEECTTYSYDTSVFHRTIVSEWDLVCSRQWLVQLSQAVLRWGILIGGVLFGILADEWGRKPTLMAGIVIQSVTGFISSMIPCYWGFVVNRFFLALASGGICVIAFVNCMETISGKWRTMMPIITQLPFCIGDIIMAALAYWLRDWRKLEFALAMSSSMYIFYWFFIMESPRWLLAKGRVDEALDILKVAARKNKRPIDIKDTEFLLKDACKNSATKTRFITFFKSKNMRLRTLLLSTNWFCSGVTFYTFSQYLGSMGRNIFITVSISGFISMPGAILCVFVINRLGRKPSVAGFQFLTALCFVILLFIRKDVYNNDWPRLILSGLALGGMAGSIPALYLYSGELFPTLVRNAGVGYVVMFGRIGSMVAPFLVTLGDTSSVLLIGVLAVITLLQILLLVPLPETKDCMLEDNFE